MNLYPLTDEEINIINELRIKRAKEKKELENREKAKQDIINALKIFIENGGKVRLQGGEYVPVRTPAKIAFYDDEMMITM